MKYNINTWTTLWGKEIKGVYRDGKSDWNTNQAILKEDEYCFYTLPFNKNGVAIDIGSFVGSASLALADLGMQVIAIEPLANNILMINKALKLNNLESKVKVYHRAIGKDDKTTIQIYHGDISNNGGFVHEFVGSAYPIPNIHADPESVQSISLDTIFEENNIQHCSIIKIDCEGGEWPCFQGASSRTLDKIKYIVGEVHAINYPQPVSRQDILNTLQGKFRDITKDIWPNSLSIDEESLGQNFIFQKK